MKILNELKRLEAARTKGEFIIGGTKDSPIIQTEDGIITIANICGGSYYALPRIAKQIDANAELIEFIFNNLTGIISLIENEQ